MRMRQWCWATRDLTIPGMPGSPPRWCRPWIRRSIPRIALPMFEENLNHDSNVAAYFPQQNRADVAPSVKRYGRGSPIGVTIEPVGALAGSVNKIEPHEDAFDFGRREYRDTGTHRFTPPSTPSSRRIHFQSAEPLGRARARSLPRGSGAPLRPWPPACAHRASLVRFQPGGLSPDRARLPHSLSCSKHTPLLLPRATREVGAREEARVMRRFESCRPRRRGVRQRRLIQWIARLEERKRPEVPVVRVQSHHAVLT